MAKRPVDQEPYVGNYPVLRDWLNQKGARCAWQLMRGPKSAPTQAVEAWTFPGGGIAIVTVHAEQHGWDIFTPAGTTKIDETFADAESRLGRRS